MTNGQIKLSRGIVGTAAASVGLFGYTVLTKPDPYPPRTWSSQAKMYPDHVAMGLGPFHYYFPEKGATSPIDRISDNELSVEEMKCLKPGINAPADIGDYVSGIVAIDSSSYNLFENKLKLIRSKFTREGDIPKLSFLDKIERGKSITVSSRRNLKGRAFNSYNSFIQRRENELTIVNALKDQFPEGSYFPLHGSKSLGKKSMPKDLEDLLRSKGLIFDVPWTVYELSCGFGRYWPDARGVFVLPSDKGTDLVVFVNSEDHLEVIAKREDGNATSCFKGNQQVIEKIEKHIDFAKDELNGFLTLRPEEAGTALMISYDIQLNRLHRHPKFVPLCRKLQLKVLKSCDYNQIQLVNFERFNLSPEEAVLRTNSAVDIVQLIDQLLDSTDTELEGLHAINSILAS